MKRKITSQLVYYRKFLFMAQKKGIFLSLLSVFLLMCAGVAALGGVAIYKFLGAGPLTEQRLVHVKSGMGVGAIAALLEEEQIIESGLIFNIAARLTDHEGFLKAGEYDFPAKVSMAEALKMIRDGDVFERKVTIPEGLTSYQVVKILNAREDLEGEISQIPDEGTLLPETYLFVAGETRSDKIQKMQAASQKILDAAWENRQEDLPIKTKEEALTLASIIEKETSVADERRRVAGVFINRLRKGMPLQTDPTVIYAITKGKIQDEGKGPLGRRLLRKDLQFDDPYNTYKYPGLPPGPIANPGKASIEAAVNPEAHDYIYFVADGTGGHAFAKTLSQHNANVAQWRKVRVSQ